jgi:hypothetical protein
MKANFLIASLILLSLIPFASATNKYEFTGYKGTPYNVGSDFGIPFNYSGTCSIQMSTTTTYTIGPSYISHVEWYSPTYSAPIGTADVSYTSSSSCRTSGGTSLQSVPKDSTTGIYENKITFSPLSATGGFSQTKTRYSCDANGGQWVNITVTPTNTSYSACQWQVMNQVKFQTLLIDDYIAGWNECGTSTYANEISSSTCGIYGDFAGSGGGSDPDNGTFVYIYNFNSTGGYIIYHFSVPQTAFPGNQFFLNTNGQAYYVIQLINLHSGAKDLIYNESFACAMASCTYDVTGAVQGIKNNLDLNTPYAFAVSFYGKGPTAPTAFSINTYPPILNLSILAEQPDLVCSAFSACINGSQSRLCHDNKGLIPDRNEFQQCFSFANQQLFLGMDSGYTANSWYCSQGNYNIITSLCARDPNVRPRRIPTGWYRNGQFVTDITARSGWVQDYVDVDLADYYAPDQSASEGSLKLWFIPRKPFVPVYNGTGTGQVVCMNTTEGQVGGMQYYVNDTFWISRNITALSPYMTISYRTKKCAETVEQTASWVGCIIGLVPPGLGCEFYGNCGSSGLCTNKTTWFNNQDFGDDYYTASGCPQRPSPSTLGVEIENIDTSEIIQSYLKTVTATNWLLGYQEDNINNMNISAVYKLSFSAYPAGGITTNDGNCIMIDDVNVNFRDTQIPCTSGCTIPDYNGDGINDYTYIEATRLSATSCTVRVLPFDPRCCPASFSQGCLDLQNGLINYTCSGTTLVTKNLVTGEYTTTPNNPTCTAQAQAANYTAGVNPFIASLLGDTGTAQMIASGFGVFLTTIFIAMIINLLIAGYLAYKVGHWEAGAITMIPLILVETMPPLNIFPFWFSLVFIIFLGLFVGEFAVKRARGGK